jgi:2-iminobutanoate/2-iminopropanoate deaminase
MNKTYGPYSPIRRAGNTYFTSGQIGVEGPNKTVFKDITSQTKQALDNLQHILSEEDLALQDVIKTTVYLKNIDDFSYMNEIYETYFTPPRPARSTIGIKELPRVDKNAAALIEIEAVACREM